jgi:hypothetical protein
MDFLNFGDDKKIKKNSDFGYSIHFANPQESLINAILKSKILTNPKVDINYKFFTFKANDVCDFKTFIERKPNKKMEYKDSLHFIWCFSQIIYYLEQDRTTFYCFDLNNIIVIDSYKFLYIGTEHLLPIKLYFPKNNEERNKYGERILEIMSLPFSLNYNSYSLFLSPETRNIRSLPAKVNYKSCYYSLAAIIFQHLFNINININININDDLTLTMKNNDDDENNYNVIPIVKDTLESILYTKLYWFLMKNLSYDNKDRTLFFI